MARRSSKGETITALLESATTVFSQVGYEGASLRDIAAGARTPLSAINMYFGTKSDLFVAVASQLWREIEVERSALLAARIAAKGGPADLRDIVFALVKPIVDRARSTTEADRRLPNLLRRWVSAPPDVKVELRRRSNTADSLRRWIDSVRGVCPTLTKSEAVWGFSFVVGALYSWEIMDNRYDEVVGSPDDDPEEIVEYLVEFAVSGMQGLVDRAARKPGLRRGATAA
ncbi:MAG: TetR family transcriptional regulator [Caulobacteraceae bacterium]|nr:TetR family transcriptional regulator [Caulobacteraceae bacterium]